MLEAQGVEEGETLQAPFTDVSNSEKRMLAPFGKHYDDGKFRVLNQRV